MISSHGDHDTDYCMHFFHQSWLHGFKDVETASEIQQRCKLDVGVCAGSVMLSLRQKLLQIRSNVTLMSFNKGADEVEVHISLSPMLFPVHGEEAYSLFVRDKTLLAVRPLRNNQTYSQS